MLNFAHGPPRIFLRLLCEPWMRTTDLNGMLFVGEGGISRGMDIYLDFREVEGW